MKIRAKVLTTSGMMSKYAKTGRPIECSKFLKFFGFDYRYDMKVLSGPMLKGDYYEYSVEIGSYVLYWKGWKFFNTRKKNGNNQESTHSK